MSESEHPPEGSPSERYELEDLFQEEAAENRHFFKITGVLVLVVLLVLALSYPFVIR
jgi:hypothetical protein